jgi:alkaline phosphatase D
LLGKEQLQWLEQGLSNSAATWKIISSSVPITIANYFSRVGLGCDNWATNSSTYPKTFVRERSEFLKYLDDKNIKNVIFITTDVHFPAVIKVDEDPNGDKDRLIFYELVSGPLSAIPLTTNPLDPTINASYLYNESKIFNFGHVMLQKDLEGNDRLIYEIRDQVGLLRPNSRLNIIAVH